jgi:hypothetical protein
MEFAACHTRGDWNFELTPRHLKIFLKNLCTLKSNNVCVRVRACVRGLARVRARDIQISFRNSTVSTPFCCLTISCTPNEGPSSAKL